MKILNMIVKNESKVIQRCFNSLKNVIDAVIVSDTGSTDDCVEVMEKWITDNDKRGKVVSHKWENFEHNRNMALVSSLLWIYSLSEEEQKEDHYIVFIDADDWIEVEDAKLFQSQMKNMSHDKYSINMKCGNLDYGRLLAVKAPKKDEKIICKWEGVLHEYMNREGNVGYIKGAHIQASREGARSVDPMKYLKDSLVLETALRSEPKNARYVFYLAQSYRDYGGPLFKKMAEKKYLERFEMGGWLEERYISLVEAAKCRLSRNKSDGKTLNLLVKAFNFHPNRLEAPYYIVRYYRLNNNHVMGYTFGKSLINLPFPTDVLFVDMDIHKWQFIDEVAICASWTNNKIVYRSLCEKILSYSGLSEPNRKRITRDMEIYG